jgi:hypothetical protein
MSSQIPEAALITPEVLEAVKDLQNPGYTPMLIRHLEEILDFFIEDICADLSNDQKLEHIQILRSTQKSLKPFIVRERTIISDNVRVYFDMLCVECSLKEDLFILIMTFCRYDKDSYNIFFYLIN